MIPALSNSGSIIFKDFDDDISFQLDPLSSSQDNFTFFSGFDTESNFQSIQTEQDIIPTQNILAPQIELVPNQSLLQRMYDQFEQLSRINQQLQLEYSESQNSYMLLQNKYEKLKESQNAHAQFLSNQAEQLQQMKDCRNLNEPQNSSLGINSYTPLTLHKKNLEVSKPVNKKAKISKEINNCPSNALNAYSQINEKQTKLNYFKFRNRALLEGYLSKCNQLHRNISISVSVLDFIPRCITVIRKNKFDSFKPFTIKLNKMNIPFFTDINVSLYDQSKHEIFKFTNICPSPFNKNSLTIRVRENDIGKKLLNLPLGDDVILSFEESIKNILVTFFNDNLKVREEWIQVSIRHQQFFTKANNKFMGNNGSDNIAEVDKLFNCHYNLACKD